MGSDADIAPGEHLKDRMRSYILSKEKDEVRRGKLAIVKRDDDGASGAPLDEPSMFHLSSELNLDQAALPRADVLSLIGCFIAR